MSNAKIQRWRSDKPNSSAIFSPFSCSLPGMSKHWEKMSIYSCRNCCALCCRWRRVCWESTAQLCSRICVQIRAGVENLYYSCLLLATSANRSEEKTPQSSTSCNKTVVSVTINNIIIVMVRTERKKSV